MAWSGWCMGACGAAGVLAFVACSTRSEVGRFSGDLDAGADVASAQESGSPDAIEPLNLTPLKSRLGLGYFSSCGIDSSGGVKCWGSNLAGQLGANLESVDSSAQPVSVVGLASGARAVFGGPVSHCAVLTDGRATCWGDSIFGELVIGGQVQPGSHWVTLKPFEAPGLSQVVSMGIGLYFHCALNVEGGAKCYGVNSAGQLGHGSLNDSYTPAGVIDLEPSVALTANGYFGCAATAAGGVKCWGSNSHGQLGDGTQEDKKSAVPVQGLPVGATAVEGGREHACAIVNGAVWCWGGGGFGQLGSGPAPNSSVPVEVSGLPPIVQLAAGVEHTCARSDAGAVWCWGDAWPNGPAQIIAGGAEEIDSGGRHSCALLSGGILQCWGDDDSGQLGTFGGAGQPF